MNLLPKVQGLTIAYEYTDEGLELTEVRFCGTGCSVLVGVQDGRVVATRVIPDSPVNRGLNCIRATSCPRSCTARTA